MSEENSEKRHFLVYLKMGVDFQKNTKKTEYPYMVTHLLFADM